ncbi:MAG TPA: hypothetical protein VGZ73_17340 [Bryobacteraceae bacterium]|nr:hypothetical protein [Bryobacteraceae bacterium]
MTRASSYSQSISRILTVLFLLAGFACAETLITPTGVDWNRGAGLWINENGTPQDAYFAGVVLISLSQNGQQYSRDTMCVDLFTDIYIGVTYNTNLVTPADIPGRNLTRVSWLLDNVLLPTQGPTYSSQLPAGDWVTSPAQGAGLQLAIWDITADGADGFSSGRVQASTAAGELTDPAVLAWAESYEVLSVGQSSNQAFVYVNSALGSGTPAQMLEGPLFTDGGPTPAPFDPAPEPATCTLAGLALIGIGLWGRRARNRQ